MQVVVLVEFLVTGVATVIAVLASRSTSWQQDLSATLSRSTGMESGSVAVFLGLCYATGIVANFAVYYPLQVRLLRPYLRRRIAAEFKTLGYDLVAETEKAAGIVLATGDLDDCFRFMRDVSLGAGQTWLEKSSDYQRALQRLARGLIVPAIVLMWVYSETLIATGLLWFPTAGVWVALGLLIYSIYVEDHELARAFVVSRGAQTVGTPARPVAKRASGLPRQNGGPRRAVAIVGMGRFGKVLYELLKAGEFTLVIWDTDARTLSTICLRPGDRVASDERDVFSCGTVFYAVPILKFAETVSAHKQHLNSGHLLIDTLSVKQHAAQVLTDTCTTTGCRAIATHPMFGPDSSENSFMGARIVMANITALPSEFLLWTTFFESQGVEVVDLSPEEHDCLAAKSQATVHLIGRLLQRMGFASTQIDTNSAKQLHQVVRTVCNDEWELFQGMHQFNPAAAQVRLRLLRECADLVKELEGQPGHRLSPPTSPSGE